MRHSFVFFVDRRRIEVIAGRAVVEAIEGHDRACGWRQHVARSALILIAEILNGVVALGSRRRIEMVADLRVEHAEERQAVALGRGKDVTGHPFIGVSQL